MDYAIIQPPFTLKFREMSKKELKDYFEWFMACIPIRIAQLTAVVNATAGFEGWRADLSPESLDALGAWLFDHVETRSRTPEELQALRAGSSFPIDIPATDLTNRTFSLAMDVGMYMSQVLLQHHPTLRWSQESEEFVDYGQPVLVHFGPAPFNPVRMVVTLAYGLAAGSRDEYGLRQIYDIWSRLASVND